MAARTRCAVVIPSYDGAHLLSDCLEALLADVPARCDAEYIVVDDGSRDNTLEVMERYRERVRLVVQQPNQGFAAACNRGADEAGDIDHVVFLNNDTMPVAGWLDALVADAEEHPEAAAVGSKLLFPDGSVQHAGIVIAQDGWPRHVYAGFPGEHPAVDRARPVIACTAASLLVRAHVFRELEGFDSAFHNGYEDVDLCLRLGVAGYQVRYCPASVVYHLESVTRWPTGPLPTVDNDRLYRERWGERVVADDVDRYIEDGLIQLRYGPYFPVEMVVSPDLAAVVREWGVPDGVDAVLRHRADQVMSLLSGEIRAALDGRRKQTGAPARERRAPVVVQVGQFQELGTTAAGPTVSILLPVKNQAADLREQLPLVLGQFANARLELVAVDSGSTDDTVDLLREYDATVVSIDPADFDHGLTRNLCAEHARGEILVFLNGRSRPCDERWLSALLDGFVGAPDVAGVCSRVLPRPDADPLTRKDGNLELSGSSRREVKRIVDWAAYRVMPVEARRALLNFHSVATAVRANTFAAIPFRSVRTIGEDLLWAREVLEAGHALVHEPSARVYHSHAYGWRELFGRNLDDGVANRDINGRELPESAVAPMIHAMVADDWRHLRDVEGMTGPDLERLQVEAVLRRTAQVVGQWAGVNHDTLPTELLSEFSRVATARRRS